jgi:hypothetical protein
VALVPHEIKLEFQLVRKPNVARGQKSQVGTLRAVDGAGEGGRVAGGLRNEVNPSVLPCQLLKGVIGGPRVLGGEKQQFPFLE